MGSKEKAIRKQNEGWAQRKEKKGQKKQHPWYTTNRHIADRLSKIWTEIIIPENKIVQKYK